MRRKHPHLKLLVVQDALASMGPHIQLLQSLRMRFILGVKPGDHGVLFDWGGEDPDVDGCGRGGASFRLPERRPIKRQPLYFTWVTDIRLHATNLMRLMRGARVRWKIENETFNTLKNQGYHFEHNFGHGYQHLSTVFAQLMLLAFLLDQVQQHCCGLFQQALAKQGYKRYFWEKLRSFFFTWRLPDWETLYRALAGGAASGRVGGLRHLLKARRGRVAQGGVIQGSQSPVEISGE